MIDAYDIEALKVSKDTKIFLTRYSNNLCA